jgi:hypothetical protein
MPTADQDKYLQQHFNVDVAKHRAAAIRRAPPAKAAAKKPLSIDERFAKLEDRERGHTKVDIGHEGAKVLQKQYDAMLVALEDSKSARVAEIKSWQPSQMPLGGNLLLKICKGISLVAAGAFPEVEFLVIAKEGIELAAKGKETLDKRTEASKDEAEALKERATEELDKLLRHARGYVSQTRDKLEKLIAAAAEKLSPDELDQLQGLNEPQLISNFVRDKLGIARGTDFNPRVIAQIQLALMQAFNDWVKEDFKARKLGEASLDVARDGGQSWDAMDLREFHDMLKNPNRFDPNELKDALRAYNKKKGKPDGWAEQQLKNLEDKLETEFNQEFAYDFMRFVPAKTD